MFYTQTYLNAKLLKKGMLEFYEQCQDINLERRALLLHFLSFFFLSLSPSLFSDIPLSILRWESMRENVVSASERYLVSIGFDFVKCTQGPNLTKYKPILNMFLVWGLMVFVLSLKHQRLNVLVVIILLII